MLYYILFSGNLTFAEMCLMFLISILVFFVSLSAHEFAHGLMALQMGDKTAKLAGRLTMNPLKHLDKSGFLCFALLGVGWAKPIPINPLNFKKFKTGMRLVSLAGILANILLGLIAAGIYAILLATVGAEIVAMQYVYLILEYFMLVNSFLALFNLLPIHPLDGFNFVASFMRNDNKFIRFSLKNGFRILLGILLFGLFTQLMFGFDILDWYLSILYNYVFIPIASLGV